MSLFRFPSCHWSNALHLLHHNTGLHPPLPPPPAVTASLEEQPSRLEAPSLRTVAIRVKEKTPNVFKHTQIIETKAQTGCVIPHRAPNKNRSRSVTSRQLSEFLWLWLWFCIITAEGNCNRTFWTWPKSYVLLCMTWFFICLCQCEASLNLGLY